jgi:hypothetical protein
VVEVGRKIGGVGVTEDALELPLGGALMAPLTSSLLVAFLATNLKSTTDTLSARGSRRRRVCR